jgi:alkanesulfonate monooxygenase SsuD/methylene tetrahydromethanopterin reductase-like flavin-dependent oxidoreductase (luciferase family)
VPFDKRVGRMTEGLRLCRALWTGKPVDWDGRWQVTGGVLAPTPYRPEGPPIWIGGNLQASLDRAGRWFDGWFPIAPDPANFASQFAAVKATAHAAGRDPGRLTGAMYLTLAIDDDAERADARLNGFLERYYSQPAALLRRRQASYAGPAAGVAEWLSAYAAAGASHLVLRFAGEHAQHLEALARVRASLGW